MFQVRKNNQCLSMSIEISEIRKRRLAAFSQVDIYPVTCEKLSNNRSDMDILQSIIEGGARIIQLRDKTSPIPVLLQKAHDFREVTRNENILLIINDHVDIALEIDADGIHLGLDDLPIEEARKLAPDQLIGASTHSLREALLAERAGADYINIGPIFPTQTKKAKNNFLGPDIIHAIASNISVPFTVMGGINRGNIDVVLAAGAEKIGMISEITKADDIASLVKEIRQKIRTAGEA